MRRVDKPNYSSFPYHSQDAIIKLEQISQELQFATFLAQELFVRINKKGADFGQFYKQIKFNTKDILQNVVNIQRNLIELIQVIHNFKINETNSKLNGRRKKILNVLKMLCIKWNILEEIQTSIRVQSIQESTFSSSASEFVSYYVYS